MQFDHEEKILVHGFAGERYIAVSDVGSKEASDILFCLPGILEVKSTFLELHSLIGKGYRIVTLDYCGRGNSDYLNNYNHYKISTYIEDVLAVYEYIIHTNKSSHPILRKFNQNVWRLQGKSIHLLGNSMGGLIAAVIAIKKLPSVCSLILNDISSLIPWTGLFSLYGNLSQSTFNISNHGNFNKTSDLAKTLHVDPDLLKAVMQATHLDIPYATTMNGIEFNSIFNSLTVPLCLIYSTDSKLVNSIAINNLKKYSEDVKFIRVAGSNHPVKLDENIIKELVRFINQKR